jgi:hypothetical protein
MRIRHDGTTLDRILHKRRRNVFQRSELLMQLPMQAKKIVWTHDDDDVFPA